MHNAPAIPIGTLFCRVKERSLTALHGLRLGSCMKKIICIGGIGKVEPCRKRCAKREISRICRLPIQSGMLIGFEIMYKLIKISPLDASALAEFQDGCPFPIRVELAARLQKSELCTFCTLNSDCSLCKKKLLQVAETLRFGLAGTHYLQRVLRRMRTV